MVLKGPMQWRKVTSLTNRKFTSSQSILTPFLHLISKGKSKWNYSPVQWGHGHEDQLYGEEVQK